MKKILAVILVFLIGILTFISLNNNSTTIENSQNQQDSDYIEDDYIDDIGQREEEPLEETTSKVTILAVGDIMFHLPQIKSAYNKDTNSYDFTDVFKYVKPYINSSDISIANFETVTYGNDIGFSGFPRFNSPVETLYALKDAGFNILNTANNHSIDRGKDGIINTIYHINSYGMKNIGTYKEPTENILIEDVNGVKIAFLSYSYGFNGLESLLTQEELSYMVSKIDEAKIKNDIEKAKYLNSDIIVIYVHWGNEYEREPSQYQIELGRNMINWGANIVLGSHPHVIQKSEIIEKDGKSNFIIYSMGNFLSNQRMESMGNKYTEDGIMVRIELEKDILKEETVIKDISYIPTWVRRYEEDGRPKYEILPVKDFLEDKNLYIRLEEREKLRITESFEDTMEMMIDY